VRKRLTSIDVVRGFVMVVMALDHVRDYVIDARYPPEDLSRASAALFATRWVTHFCAPTFFLLAGVGIGLLDERQPTGQVSRYLVTRGLWLLLLELVITPIGWQFGFQLIPAFALVLWTLGWSMIALALLVHVPRAVLLALSLITVLGHNLLDSVRPESFGRFAGLWHVLHVPGFAIPNVLFVAYPLIPWVAVMCLGFLLARVFQWEPGQRRRFLIQAGVVATVLFVILRFLNEYGNPFPWSLQGTTALTVASFLNVQKYPPSLDFLLMTLGPALVALALTEQVRGRVARWLAVYGRVPLFFYVVHIFVAHAAAVLVALLQSGALRRIKVITEFGSQPEWYGLPLPGVYLVWAVVVIALYHPCRWFARVKEARSEWWIRYL
jgi:uncharacterized membrane protein